MTQPYDTASLTWEKLHQIYKDHLKREQEEKYNKRFFCPFSKPFNSRFYVNPNFKLKLLEIVANPIEVGNKIFNPIIVEFISDNRIEGDAIYYEDYRHNKTLHPVLDLTVKRSKKDYLIQLINILLKYEKYDELERFLENWDKYQQMCIKL